MPVKSFVPSVIFFALALSLGHADEKTVHFSGYDWSVRESAGPEGPGPNYFASRSVFFSRFGILLSLRERHPFFSEARYESSEIFSSGRFSYGTFELDFIREDSFDSRAVFGFFLYDGENPPNFSEADFESSRWDNPENNEGQFSVQPGGFPGQSFAFSIPGGIGEYTAIIHWTRDRMEFAFMTKDGKEFARWAYVGNSLPFSVSETETVRVHANLWLFGGSHPAGDGSLSVLLTGFRYIPESLIVE